MPASRVCHERSKKVENLAEMFYSHLCKPEHLQQIKETGALTPTYSMRHRCTRERVSWATSLDGRWFTNGLVKSALQHLLKTHADVVIPADTPGFCMEQWLITSAEKLAQLLKRAWTTSKPKPGIWVTKQHLTQRRTEFINRSSSKDSQFLLATYILSFCMCVLGRMHKCHW